MLGTKIVLFLSVVMFVAFAVAFWMIAPPFGL